MNTEKRDFDKEAATWDENPARVRLAKDIADAISKQIALKSDINALDFGCGTGLLTIQLQPLVQSIVGIDSSRGMLDIFNAKIAKLNLTNVSALLVDLDKGDTLTGNYHLVVSSMTLHHVKEIKPLFDQFYNILAPSGFLCVADLDLDDGQFHEDNTGIFHFGFDRATLRNTFIEAGFDNVQDISATEVMKPSPSGETRRFTVFLMTGQKRSDNA
ncbi:MAG: SAM-dependent methyltransferase [Syntrophus sp. (in: bacteria)]|nr:SAM-dependent methyltransferase [Syntrophus sp. (in: bacteria)]